jgi:acyl carrier protein
MSEKNSAEVASLLEIVRSFKGRDYVEPKGSAADLNFIEDLGLDSLEIINLLFRVEETYGIQISDKELKANKLIVVGNMAAYIAKHKK